MVEAMDMAGNVYQPASSLPVLIDRTAPTEGLTIDLNADSDSSDHRNLLGDNEDNYTHGTEASDPDGAGILHISGTGAGSAGRVNLYFEDAAGNKLRSTLQVTFRPKQMVAGNTILMLRLMVKQVQSNLK